MSVLVLGGRLHGRGVSAAPLKPCLTGANQDIQAASSGGVTHVSGSNPMVDRTV